MRYVLNFRPRIRQREPCTRSASTFPITDWAGQMKYLLVVVGVVLGMPTCAFAGSVERVIDGDDLCLCGNDSFARRFAGRSSKCDHACVRVRLCGIDAPELNRPGGGDAACKLTVLAGGQVTCIAVGDGTTCDGRSQRFNRDRVVAQCFSGNADIACELVKSGHARDWPKYSGGHYARCAR